MRIWPWPRPEAERIARIPNVERRLEAYVSAVDDHLSYPKLGVTSWSKDVEHLTQGVVLLERMAVDTGFSASAQRQALEAVRDLSVGPRSPIARSRAHQDAREVLSDLVSISANVRAIRSGATLDERIAALAARERSEVASEAHAREAIAQALRR